MRFASRAIAVTVTSTVLVTSAMASIAGCGGDSGPRTGDPSGQPGDDPAGTVAPVRFDPPIEEQTNDVAVRLASTTAGATLCYTVDGVTPGCEDDARCAKGSIAYDGAPISIVETGTALRALACKKGMPASEETRIAYTLTGATPTFGPTPESFDPDRPVPVTIATTTRQGVIHYTLDGTYPDCGSPLTFPEKGTIPTFTADTTIHALTCKKKYTASEIVAVTYVGRECTGDFAVATRAQLQALSRCRTITGSLSIFGTDAVDLAPLQRLERVGGGLSIANNNTLTSLHGLEALTAIGGEMSVRDNPQLARLDALGKLQRVEGMVHLADNALTEWVGPSALAYVGGLTLQNESKLRRVAGFPALVEIGGDLQVLFDGALVLWEDMPALTTIRGKASFQYNGALQGVPGFGNVRRLGGLQIEANNELVHVGFGQVTAVQGSVTLAENPKLVRVEMKNVAAIKGALHVENTGLADLTGLGGLRTIDGSLTVTKNKRLEKVDTLGELRELGGNFTVAENEALPECEPKRIARKLQEEHRYSGLVLIYGNLDTGTCN
ncbi:chitobiase/beta-hexosaminidase C-terminal domain-containing protein [Pendulispora albinea]|uniref:Chitobiase/beta-hexosaminidase C-terminal domain-containing protein n=1 Tax=Pendulispora albinea TaxID=2741071 RepID=A0ABZ2M938_9BACT